MDHADRDKHQWFTPDWATDAILWEHYRDLPLGALLLEPSCGIGNMLSRFPAPAVGIEIDPELAEMARARTTHRVITGDFMNTVLDPGPDHIIGNPPFELSIIDGFLDKSFEMLPAGGTVGFILPAYMFQTAGRVGRYLSRWSISYQSIPRNIFFGLSKPLCFVKFAKDSLGLSTGLFLYRETILAHRKNEDIWE